MKIQIDGLPALLTIVFIFLKLTWVISWSWWWVLSPLWITAAVIISVWLAVVLFWVSAAIFTLSVMGAYMLGKRLRWLIGEKNV